MGKVCYLPSGVCEFLPRSSRFEFHVTLYVIKELLHFAELVQKTDPQRSDVWMAASFSVSRAAKTTTLTPLLQLSLPLLLGLQGGLVETLVSLVRHSLNKEDVKSTFTKPVKEINICIYF